MSLMFILLVFFGIDVSRYQANIQWHKIDADFVIIKATYGYNRVDSKFSYNYNNCKKTKGVYHFFVPSHNGIKQADKFYNIYKPTSNDIYPVIDIEYTKYWKKHKKQSIKNLKLFLNRYEKLTGIKPIIYTSPIFWNQYCSKYIDAKDYKLWIADYRKRKSPQIPKGFSKHHIWQHTNKGKVNGIKGMVDKNILCTDICEIIY